MAASSPLLLLLAHGSSDPHWVQPFQRVLSGVQASGVRAELAYLQHCSPALEEVGEAYVHEGGARVRVLPCLIGAGAHVREELPRRVADLTQRHEGLQIEIAPVLGDHEPFLEALTALATELGVSMGD